MSLKNIPVENSKALHYFQYALTKGLSISTILSYTQGLFFFSKKISYKYQTKRNLDVLLGRLMPVATQDIITKTEENDRKCQTIPATALTVDFMALLWRFTSTDLSGVSTFRSL